MRPRRRKLVIVAVVLALACLVAAAVYLRKLAPPEPARLLPNADAFVYVNLKPLRRADLLTQLPPVVAEADYQRFVQDTGIQFERDLDEVALSVHAPASQPVGSEGRLHNENRYSEIFAGRFNSEKLSAFFRQNSESTEIYRNTEIFNIRREDRTVRAAILSPSMVAVSNFSDPAVIRSVVDRSKKLAMPFGGPKLLRQYYRKVPFAPIAWVITRVESPGAPAIPGGFDFFFPSGTVLVGSVRYLPGVDLKAVAYTTSDAAAKRITEQLQGFLGLFRTLEANAASGSDPDAKQFFDSIKVEQNGDRAVLTAELPKGFIKKVLTEPPESADKGLKALPERHNDLRLTPQTKTKPKHGSKRK